MSALSISSLKRFQIIDPAYLEPWKSFEDGGSRPEEEGECWQNLARLFIKRNGLQINTEAAQFAALVEELIVIGDERTRYMVTIYFLEALVNLLEKLDRKEMSLLRCLGPEAKEFIRYYNNLCGVEDTF